MAYQYAEMSQAQIETFLQAPRFAIVGTNRRNGPPQLTPVWYLFEGGLVYVTMFVDSAKYRNLRRDPRASVCVVGESHDARAVMIYGTAELVVEQGPWVEELEWRLVRQYCGSGDEAKAYMDSEGMQGERALAVITPGKVIAQDYN